MKKQTTYWATILTIIEAGLTRDAEKTRNYSALLAERLEEAGDPAIAERIRRILQSAPVPRTPNGASSSSLSPAQVSFAPVDPESRSAFIDEVIPDPDELLVLNSLADAEVKRFIALQEYVDEFVRTGIRPPRSLLLYGPPGCGKSTTARFIARELKLPLLSVRLDAVMSSFLGTTAKNLRTVFDHATRRAAVLFLDEFDALAKMRDDANEIGEIKRIVNSLIQNIDASPRLYVIAATNHEHLLDPAIWRRFDVVVQLSLPDNDERQVLLRHFLGQEVEEINEAELRWVAQITEGSSGADLEQIALRARQERVLVHDEALLHLLVREIWKRSEAGKIASGRPKDEQTALVRFIDAHTEGKISAKNIESLTGVPSSAVFRIRRSEGEMTTNVR